MTLFETYLQKKAHSLFSDYYKNMENWEKYVFVVILDNNNILKIRCGDEILYSLKEIKGILENMIKELVEYKETEEETYMIFEMDGYYIDHDRCWIYEYEIDDYNDIIENKLCEYIILSKQIDDYNKNVKQDNDILLDAITQAISRM